MARGGDRTAQHSGRAGVIEPLPEGYADLLEQLERAVRGPLPVGDLPPGTVSTHPFELWSDL